MASVDTQLRASEIKNVLLAEIERYEEGGQAEEIGEVLEVKDGIARIYGLGRTMASEMLEVTSSDTGDTITALALNLEEDNIGAVILGDWTVLHEGDQVRRTGRVLDIPVGPEYLGRVVEFADTRTLCTWKEFARQKEAAFRTAVERIVARFGS